MKTNTRPLPRISKLGNEIIAGLQDRFGITRREVLEKLLRDEMVRLQLSEGFSLDA